MSYDDSQQAMIDAREGFVVADAGPGTGKTHTVTGRCLAILRDSLDDPDCRSAMLTFTRNAAAEMEDRLLGEASVLLSSGELDRDRFNMLSAKIKQMFIGTFDSFCLRIVKEAPWEISTFFGFKESLTTSATTTENETLNKMYFRRFVNQWLEEYGTDPAYGEYPAIVSGNPDDLYELINRLMCMGIMPLRMGGWFGGTPRPKRDEVGPAGEPVELRGDPAAVLENLKAWAAENRGNKKTKDDFAKRCYDSMLIDGFDTDVLSEEHLRQAAYDDRDALLKTVHDIFYRYMERCVATDHLTFGLTACFAFVGLYQKKAIRDKVAVDYLIVDEFQDTNTLQMMISMMVLRKPNLCVVGDWRQGIYGFRYVSPENIIRFHERLVTLGKFLNDDGNERVCYPLPTEDEVTKLALNVSYRSSQKIVHTAYLALALPAHKGEPLDEEVLKASERDEITSRNDDLLKDHTAVTKIACGTKDAEIAEVVHRVAGYVEGRVPVFDKGSDVPRPARFGDIAVLCRTTRNCRAVYRALRACNIPAFLQGDMEIMNTVEGKLLLAWMRYVENGLDARGYVPILGYLGYSAAEIREFQFGKMPEKVTELRKTLQRKRRRITDFTTAVFDFHHIDNDISQAITGVLSSVHSGSLMTISEIISMIETDIERKTRYNIDGQPESDAVNVLTMHKSKGLEYPIVIIPFVDSNTMPLSDRSEGDFRYSKETGVRCTRTRITMANGDTELDGSWKTQAVFAARSRDYDEERRLFFVAISRARQYVDILSGKTPSSFFECVQGDTAEPHTEPHGKLDDTYATSLPVPDASFPVGRPRSINVHDVMGKSGGDEGFVGAAAEGRGMNYGTRVHKVAQAMVNGGEPSPQDLEDIKEIDEIRKVIASLPEGMIRTESPCNLAIQAEGYRISVAGNIDLLVIGKDRAYVYDWKTDINRKYREEYVTQLSIYAKCVERAFPQKKVEAAIVWLAFTDGVDFIEPLTEEQITEKAMDVFRKREKFD